MLPCVGQVEEERPVLVPLDELHRLPVENVGQVALKAGDLLVAIHRTVGDVDHVAGRVLAAEELAPQDPGVGRMRKLLRGRD